MKVSKIILTAGALTIYIFFPTYRYYAFGAMILHQIVIAIKQKGQLTLK